MLYPRSGATRRVGGDAVDAVDAQRARGVDEHGLRLEDAGRDHRLEHVELELPASAAIETVRSLPITRKQTMLTTSGITGLTLPGMIDEPGCLAGG
jgi:hypothetical protein